MDYSSIFHRSWRVVKREKTLWVFGMVFSTFSAGASWIRSNPAGSFQNLFQLLQKKDSVPQEVPQKVSQVLGAMTRDPWAALTAILSGIPTSYWATLILSIIALLLLGWILAIFLENWSLTALYSLALEAEKGEISLFGGSELGKKHWLRLFWGSLLGTLLLAGLVVLSLLVAGAFFSLLWFLLLLKPVAILLGVLYLFVFMVFAVVATVWMALTKLVIVFDGYSVTTSLRFAWKVAKKFFWQVLFLGLIHFALNAIVGFGTVAVFGVFAGVLAIMFIINQSVALALSAIFFLPLVFLISLLLPIQGILKAFMASNWALMYEEMKKRPQWPGMN